VTKSKPWDSTLKWLIRVNPSAFVHWFLPGAVFVRERPYELEIDKREVDALLETTANGQQMLLHIEFQAYNDTTMAERLLLYNVLAREVHKLPVLSCVVYLLKDGVVPQSPLRLTIPTGQNILEFHFESIEMGELNPEDILSMQSVALIPLLPLTKGGASREEIVRMFAELNKQQGQSEAQTTELALIGYTLASLVLNKKNNVDLEWLVRRFREMHDILRDTPIYQEILLEGREEGREEGRLENSKHILRTLTQNRFPALASIAEEQATVINDLTLLNDIIVKIASAQTEGDAYFALRGWDKTLNG